MTSTKIDWTFNRIARLQDLADLAALLFPNNANLQHAFICLWLAIKWSPHRIVPNFDALAKEHGISRRTLQRVRAKMRRMGLIDHVSRFNKAYGCREGWILSARFERGLRQMSQCLQALKDTRQASRKKEEMLIEFARARKATRSGKRSGSETRGDGG